jgi:hypothetical protein
MAAMPWPRPSDVKRSFRLQPLATVLSVGPATAPAISLADRLAPPALVPRTAAMRTVTTLATAAAEAGADVTLQIGEGPPHVYQLLLGTPRGNRRHRSLSRATPNTTALGMPEIHSAAPQRGPSGPVHP